MDDRHDEPVRGREDRGGGADEADATAAKAATERNLMTEWLSDPTSSRAFSILAATLKDANPRPKRLLLSEGLMGLVGAVIGSLASILAVLFTERSSSERDRQAQFREERKAAYAELWSAGFDLANASIAPKDELEKRRQENQRSIEHAFGEIGLFATQQVVDQAGDVYGHCRFLLETPVTRGECRTALNRFREAARKELGLGTEKR